jgi:hypothetical protein
MLSFATPAGQPLNFSPDIKLEYNLVTRQLKAFLGHIKPEPLCFNLRGHVSDSIDLAGMDKDQFLRVCDIMCATTNFEFMRYTFGIENSIVYVSFVIDTDKVVATESPE